jgi:hypothetical protein
VYRLPTDALDGRCQQAPGFCAQKSSNCWAFEPSGGDWSLLAESWLVSGAVVPPPVLSVVVPVLPVGVLVALGVVVSDDDDDDEELLSLLELSLDVLVSLLELSLFDDAASVGDVSDWGIVTSAGGPGTCWAAVSPPPQPAAARASRPAATSAMMRPGMWLTPP